MYLCIVGLPLIGALTAGLFGRKLGQIGRAHSELQSHHDLVCRLLLEKKNNKKSKKKKKNTL